MTSTIAFYVALQFFALVAWPLAFHACSRLRDRGYSIAKILGVVLVTYLNWLLMHSPLAPAVKGFSFQSVAIVFVILVVLAGIVIHRRRFVVARWIQATWRQLLMVELIFLAAFLAIVALRVQTPHISYHLSGEQTIQFSDNAAEKFTDFAILNSLLTSPSFPPHDAWVAGEHLNYYYFGHLLWATVIKYTSVEPAVGFNLALAGNFALIAVAAFGLGWNLTGRKRYGLLNTFFVSLAGNLDGLIQFLTYLTGRWFQFDSTQLAYIGRPWWRNFDYWRSSRAVENTITEFPAFSTVLGDLHAHYLALPILIAGITLCVQLHRAMRAQRSLLRFEIHHFDLVLLLALLFGALSAANSWDVITLGAILGATAWSARSFQPASAFTWKRTDYRPWAALGEGFLFTLVVVLLGVVVLFLPFLRHFDPPRQQTDAEHLIPGLLKAVDAVNKTAPLEFVSHWFLLMLLPMALLWRVVRSKGGHDHGEPIPRWVPAVILASAACCLRPIVGGWVGLVTGGITLYILFEILTRRIPPRLHLFLLWMATFFSLATVCEFVYVDDIFSGAIQRINTVFKVYYGMWILAAACAILAIHRWFHIRFSATEKWTKAIILAAAVYPILSVPNRIASTTQLGHWQPPAGIQGVSAPEPWLETEAQAESLEEALDGLRYLQYLHPTDARLIEWINARTPSDARIVELPGNQYSYHGRFSTLTGRPAVGGWLTHSWAWRGHYFGDTENPNNPRHIRETLAQEAYTTTDTLVFDALDQLGVDYIIYGELEQQAHPRQSGFPNSALLKRYEPVFEEEEAMVLKRKENDKE